ncbi:MAG TPA: polyphenol oxidase family protein [Gemmatimonadales bacterium]
MVDPSAAGVQDPTPEWYDVPGWRDRFGVAAGVTTRHAGSFELTAARPAGPTLERWRALQTRVGFPAMVTSRQVHGAAVARHDDVSGWLLLDGYDGHVTRKRGILLTITVADCIPIYLLDPDRGAAALLHAGWRGAASGMLRTGIEKLVELAGSPIRDLVIHLGVGICGRCYQVGPEVLAAFGFSAPESQSPRLDLRRVLSDQARGLGVGEVSSSAWCSAHDGGTFFSHRASRGRDGRMAAYVGFPE